MSLWVTIMNKIEIFRPYFESCSDYVLLKTLNNVEFVKDIFANIDNENDRKKCLYVGMAYKKWIDLTDVGMRSLLTMIKYDILEEENKYSFHIHTTLPEIENDVFIEVDIFENSYIDNNKVTSLSVKSFNSVYSDTVSLYNDQFSYLSGFFSLIANEYIEREAVELESDFEDLDCYSIKYYFKDNNTIVNIKLNIDRLDKVRDQWYHFLKLNNISIINEE